MELECNVCRLSCSHKICFVLKPCNHVMCVKCFHQSVPASYAMQCPCPGCQRWVETSTLFEMNDRVKSEENEAQPDKDPDFLTQMRSVQEVSHFEPDEQMDPFRHWAIKKPDLYNGFIYVAFRYNNEEASFYRANFKATNSTVVLDDNSSDDLVKIFARVLHPLLFHKNFVKNEGNDLPSEHSSPEGSIPTQHHQRHQQLALTSLYALSSGRVMTLEELAEVAGGSLLCHKTMKQKAIECAKSLAKKLLHSKRKNQRFFIPQQREPRRGQGVLSPVVEDQAGDSVVMDITQAKTLHNLSSTLPDAQVPYLLGILLFAAAWIISNGS
jgi:hypothetical protein